MKFNNLSRIYAISFAASHQTGVCCDDRHGPLPNFPDLPPEDKMGFAVPKTPAHSLMLLNSYMRTDMLQHIHVRLHKMRENDEPGSPLHHMAKSLEQVIDIWDGIHLVECFTRNHFHIDPDYEFRPERDYLHDIRLMKHHLECHRSTIKELDRWR